MKRAELIPIVRQYALDHYTEGWDVIVECYTDQELGQLIGRARTPVGAIRAASTVADVFYDRQMDALISAGIPHLRAYGGALLTYGESRFGGQGRWQCQRCGVYIVTWEDDEDLRSHYCEERSRR